MEPSAGSVVTSRTEGSNRSRRGTRVAVGAAEAVEVAVGNWVGAATTPSVAEGLGVGVSTTGVGECPTSRGSTSEVTVSVAVSRVGEAGRGGSVGAAVAGGGA
jgi:hypothetical protein